MSKKKQNDFDLEKELLMDEFLNGDIESHGHSVFSEYAKDPVAQVRNRKFLAEKEQEILAFTEEE